MADDVEVRKMAQVRAGVARELRVEKAATMGVMTSSPDCLTTDVWMPAQAAFAFNVRPKTLQRWVKSGRLPGVVIGKALRFRAGRCHDLG